MLEIDPGARTIVSSGYSQDPMMSRYRDYGFCGVVSKPYSVSELTHERTRHADALPEVGVLRRCLVRPPV